MTTLAPPSPSPGPGPGPSPSPGPTATPGDARRRHPWRLPAILVGIVLLGGVVIAWLQVGVPGGYLDPGNTGPNGGHALAAILAGRGTRVITATRAATTAESAESAATILVTNPRLLTPDEFETLADSPASLVIVDPDQTTLDALAPGITIAGQAGTTAVNPGCALPAATAAGDADMGGTVFHPPAQSTRCYPSRGHPSLVSYRTAAHQVTVLGTGAPFTNRDLADHGNAALAVNLLTSRSLVWLTPRSSPATPPPATQQRSFISLIPEPVYMIAAELGIAVVLLALWRMRRLGPIVPERLPAIVRAAETAEGHGRLYHARRAREQAATHLREATMKRIIPLLGLPPDATPETVAARTQDDSARILTGPAPDDDAGLVALADKLDALERKAGAR